MNLHVFFGKIEQLFTKSLLIMSLILLNNYEIIFKLRQIFQKKSAINTDQIKSY
jgi:hypothetical protein